MRREKPGMGPDETSVAARVGDFIKNKSGKSEL